MKINTDDKRKIYQGKKICQNFQFGPYVSSLLNWSRKKNTIKKGQKKKKNKLRLYIEQA